MRRLRVTPAAQHNGHIGAVDKAVVVEVERLARSNGARAPVVEQRDHIQHVDGIVVIEVRRTAQRRWRGGARCSGCCRRGPSCCCRRGSTRRRRRRRCSGALCGEQEAVRLRDRVKAAKHFERLAGRYGRIARARQGVVGAVLDRREVRIIGRKVGTRQRARIAEVDLHKRANATAPQHRHESENAAQTTQTISHAYELAALQLAVAKDQTLPCVTELYVTAF